MKQYLTTRHNNMILCLLPGRNKVLSTSVLNGGIQENITTIFNLNCRPDPGEEMYLRGGTYESHLRWFVQEKLGMTAEQATGYLTAAQIENAASVTMTYRESGENHWAKRTENVSDKDICNDGSFTVKAVVTGGIDKNGSRIGEDAHWHEQNGIWREITDEPMADTLPLGTINIMLFISANLTDGALSRALVTCTEAKTAAIQELCLPSLYSEGLATGSGTDGTIIVSDLDSPLILTEAGKHTKLGELIGKTVKKAVKEALIRQTHVSPENLRNVFHFLGRWGCTEKALIERITEKGISCNVLKDWIRYPNTVSWAALEAHLLDLYCWGMIEADDYQDAEQRLTASFFSSDSEGKFLALEIIKLCQTDTTGRSPDRH